MEFILPQAIANHLSFNIGRELDDGKEKKRMCSGNSNFFIKFH